MSKELADFELVNIKLIDGAVKGKAGLKVKLEEEDKAGSVSVRLAEVGIGEVVGVNAGLKLTGGVKDDSGRTGLIAETKLANANVGPLNASLGLSATTAAMINEDGVSLEVIGTGFSAGPKGFEIKFLGCSIGINWKK